jgi:pyruvate dehydrogenase E1 component alpha subunit
MRNPDVLRPIRVRGMVEPIDLLDAMLTIRGVETAVATASLAGRFEGPVHVSLGQEGASVGVVAAMADGDVLFSNHRGHGHALAFGLDPRAVVAEILGDDRGTAGGRGGSMHIFDPPLGFYGTNGIVGDGAGLVTGAGLALARTATGDVAVSIFGDGAMGTGIVYEAMNLAALWRLPVIFVCENNGFAEMTPTSVHLSSDPAARARSFGLSVEVTDGRDVLSVRDAMAGLLERARDRMPSFLEIRTDRWTGHYVGDQHSYRPPEAEVSWRNERCPIRGLASRLAHDDAWVATQEKRYADAASRLVEELLGGA